MSAMANALHLSGLPAKTHQGIGARLVRQLGGALRRTVAGITRLRTPRHPAVPEPDTSQTPPRRPRLPRKFSPGNDRAGASSGWFGLGRLRSKRPAFPDGDAPFTPQAYPGLTPEVCEFLNTPTKDCDPALVCLLLGALARHIAESLPPELGLDAEALFSTLWSRLADPLGEPAPDATAAEQADDAPVGPADAVPDAPPLPPEAPAPDSPQSATLAAAAVPEDAPPYIALPNRSFRGSRWLPCGLRRFFAWRRGWLSHTWRDRQRALPPPRRLFYACAGPP